MTLALLALPLACRSEPPGDRPRGDDGSTPTATGHTGTVEAPAHSAAPTDCPEDPDLALAVTAVQGALPNQLDLSVTATVPAAVAARCVADADPDDVHLVESTAPALAHDLRVGGLLSEQPYTCAVVATCPRAASPPAEASFTTGALPFPLDDLVVETPSALAPTPGYTLANWELPNCLPPVQDDHWAFLWDARGDLRWWYPLRGGLNIATEVTVHPTLPYLEWGGGDTAFGWPRTADPLIGVVDDASALPLLPDARYSHDFRRLADGRLAVLTYLPNREGRHEWTGFAVQVWDPATGAVTFSLDSQELVDTGVLAPPPLGVRDAWHANAIDWDETADGPVLTVSLCDAQQILSVDATTRAVRWQLGAGLGWTVVDDVGNPLPEDALPQCTHGIEVDAAGRVLVYDNGRDRLQSAASEWELDPVARVARRTWFWTEPGWYERVMGDIEDLGDGRILVTQSTHGCGDGAQAVEVVRATGEVVARRTFPRGSVYRSEQIDACRLFGAARDCARVAERLAELAPLFGG